MTIKNFIPAAMKSIAAMFGLNKAKMNQIASAPCPQIRTPQVPATAASPATVAKASVAPKRAVKPVYQPAPTPKIHGVELMPVKVVKNHAGRPHVAKFLSHSGTWLRAHIVEIQDGAVVLSRNNGPGFERTLLA